MLHHPRISLRLITPPPLWLQRLLPRPLAMVTRVLMQICQLAFMMMVRLPAPGFILLQTPPCVPSFAVCRLVAWARGAKFIIDWHNLAYTLMALKHGARSPLVGRTRWGGKGRDTNSKSNWRACCFDDGAKNLLWVSPHFKNRFGKCLIPHTKCLIPHTGTDVMTPPRSFTYSAQVLARDGALLTCACRVTRDAHV